MLTENNIFCEGNVSFIPMVNAFVHSNEKVNFRVVYAFTKPASFLEVFCAFLYINISLFAVLCNNDLQGNTEEMMVRYEHLLTYIKSAVTRNYSEKSINAILDYVSTSKQVSY